MSDDLNNKKIFDELKRSNTIAKIAFALALIFMGLQFWPTEYNYGMRLGIATIFLLGGLWITFFSEPAKAEGKRQKKIAEVFRYFIHAIVAIGIILAIILYIKSAF